jgi:hypothetical protein
MHQALKPGMALNFDDKFALTDDRAKPPVYAAQRDG